MLLRMVPFVERNYNMVELGPRGTGKSHLFQQVSPYAHLISGGKATVAKMFVNNASGQRGLVCQYDVVCFDEVSGVSFDQKDGVNIMKGYMESGEFSRGKESIRADGGIVMVGNFDVDVAAPAAGRSSVRAAAAGDARRHRLHGPHPRLPAGLGRSQSSTPTTTSPITSASSATSCPSAGASLRIDNRVCRPFKASVHFGGASERRDIEAVNKTMSGLSEAAVPGSDNPVPDEDLEWIVRLALEARGA